MERAEAGAAVAGLDDVVARAPQQLCDQAPDVGVVVDDEDARSAHTVFIRMRRPDPYLGRPIRRRLAA
jgi:hypothetical protein